MSSHDTGDDATLEAKTIEPLSLTPAMRRGYVGLVARYTLGVTFEDAITIDLIQDACYWTDDARIALADDAEGDRSAVVCAANGTTQVRTAFADWYAGYPVISGSVAGAFLTVGP